MFQPWTWVLSTSSNYQWWSAATHCISTQQMDMNILKSKATLPEMTNPTQHIFWHLEQQVWCWHSWWNLPKSDWKLPGQFNKRVKEATLSSAATHSSHCPYMFCAQTPTPSWRKVSGSLICHRGLPCKRESFDNWKALMPQECNDRDLMFLFAVFSIGGWPSCSRDVLWIRKPICWSQKNWLHGFMVSFITDVLILSLPQIVWYSLAVNHAFPSWRGLKCH